MKRKSYEIATFTAPRKLLKKVRAKARRIHGKRGFSRHVTRVLAEDVRKTEGGE